MDGSTLDTSRNRYEWQIMFSSLTGVIPTVIYGENLLNIDESLTVQVEEGKMLTSQTDQKIFISLADNLVNAADPAFSFSIDLVSYPLTTS